MLVKRKTKIRVASYQQYFNSSTASRVHALRTSMCGTPHRTQHDGGLLAKLAELVRPKDRCTKISQQEITIVALIRYLRIYQQANTPHHFVSVPDPHGVANITAGRSTFAVQT